MHEDDQLQFLTDLGKRLYEWSCPGDKNDYLVNGAPLWTPDAIKFLQKPSRVGDVLLLRWIKVKNFANQRPVSLRLTPALRQFSKARTRKNIILKAGRGGFTTYCSRWALLRTMTGLGRTAVMVANELEDSKSYFNEVLFSFNSIPGSELGQLAGELKAGAWRTGGRGGKQNVREIYFPVLNSGFKVDTAGDASPAQGSSIQDLICDEVARWKKGEPEQVLGGLMSHVTGEDTEVNVFSRPFGDVGLFYQMYQEAKTGLSDFKPHFFQWWWNPFQVEKTAAFAPDAEECNCMDRYHSWRAREAPKDCGLSAELSYSKLAWRRKQKLDLKDKFLQEFAEDDAGCFLGSGNCPFDALAMAKILKDATPVIAKTTSEGEDENGLLVWHEAEPGERYILFADVASTLGSSRAAWCIIKASNGLQCAEWVGRIDPLSYAGLMRYHAKSYNEALIAVENNLGDISVTVLNALADYPNLYYYTAPGEQKRLGWHTDPKSRPAMMNTLADMILKEPDKFHSKRLVSELKNHWRNGDRIEPRKGLTGDIVIAAAGAHEIRKRGNWAIEPWLEVIHVNRPQGGTDRGWKKMGGA